MATNAQWALVFAQQALADFETFQKIRSLDIPECHKLQFLQMACEKLAKAHLYGEGSNPGDLKRHGVIRKVLPVVIRQTVATSSYKASAAKAVIRQAKRLCEEINLLAPAVDRDEKRPDNCEYPWTDANENLHSPLIWRFTPTQLLSERGGENFLTLVKMSIDRVLAANK